MLIILNDISTFLIKQTLNVIFHQMMYLKHNIKCLCKSTYVKVLATNTVVKLMKTNSFHADCCPFLNVSWGCRKI